MKKKYFLLIMIAAVVLLTITLYIKNDFSFDLKHAYSVIIKSPPYIFIAIYSMFPFLFLPIIPLAILGGFLYGPVLGTLYSAISCTLGGSFAFLLSRHYFKDWVIQKSPGRVAVIQSYIKKNAWQFIALSRVTPIFPFNIQNYLFGVTDVKLKTFFFCTLFSIIPGLFLYGYIGYLGRQSFNTGELAKYQIAIFLVVCAFIFGSLFLKKFRTPSKIEENL